MNAVTEYYAANATDPTKLRVLTKTLNSSCLEGQIHIFFYAYFRRITFLPSSFVVVISCLRKQRIFTISLRRDLKMCVLVEIRMHHICKYCAQKRRHGGYMPNDKNIVRVMFADSYVWLKQDYRSNLVKASFWLHPKRYVMWLLPFVLHLCNRAERKCSACTIFLLLAIRCS